MEIKELRRSANVKGDPVKVKEMLDKLRKEHNKLVKGKFEFLDAQGGFIEFTYRYFPEDLLVTYKFIHNEICEIPMGLVKHINNTVKKVRNFGNGTESSRGVELGQRGIPSTYSTQSRIRFTPVDMF
jgi:hypothetical protein